MSDGFGVDSEGAAAQAGRLDRAAEHLDATRMVIAAAPAGTPQTYGEYGAAQAHQRFSDLWYREVQNTVDALHQLGDKVRQSMFRYRSTDADSGERIADADHPLIIIPTRILGR